MPWNRRAGHQTAALSLAAATVVLGGCASTDPVAVDESPSPVKSSVVQPQQPRATVTEKPVSYPPAAPESTVRTPSGHLVNDCVPRRLHKYVTTLTTEDGKHLSILVLGNGPNAVYFGHQYGGQICNFLDLAEEFAGRGYRVMLPEFRNHVASEKSAASSSLDAKAAFDKLKDLGTKRVFLVGASCGGTTAAVQGVESGIPVVGLTLLSSPARCDDDAVAAVKKIKEPSLFMVAHNDMQGAHEQQIRELYEASAAPDKHLVAIDGEAHGTLMLYGSKEADKRRAMVVSFIVNTYTANNEAGVQD
ncbi:alpha/beta hydrolase [Streptomyces sp. NPDC046984]|uniref:alpha/beta hydrolase family protein n=1 Tax=Streptomyces sp. NPDC046984 TaxID=3155138 RepID=UPI0033C16F84